MAGKVITLEEIKVLAEGEPFEISNWLPNRPKITVRVKGIDMTPHMLKLSSMPNKLKTSAYEVFNGKVTPKKDAIPTELSKDELEQMVPLMEAVAADMLLEPKFEEIQALYPMTLKQKMELFQFAMGGINDLDAFRTESGSDDGAAGGGESVQSAAQFLAGGADHV